MKGEIALKILETLKDIVLTTIDLTEVFLKAGYGASSSHIQFEFDEIQRGRQNQNRSDKERFYDALCRLHRDNLIEKRREGKKNVWFITSKGKERLQKLKKRLLNNLPKINYTRKIAEGELKIVIFDIPEKEKRKRNWLRANLLMLDFKMLQKSVWVGKIKIPEEFINALKDLKLLPFIEIFTISKQGTLKQKLL